MGKVEIDFDNDYNVNAKSNLIPEIKAYGKLDLTRLISALADQHNTIVEKVQIARANDGRFIGSERAIISDSIDSFINIAILIEIYLQDHPSLCLIECSNFEKKIKFSITCQNESWYGSGSFNRAFSSQKLLFKDFYLNQFYPAINTFIKEYKNACQDNKLTDHEKITLSVDIRILIVMAFYLRLLFTACLIDQ